MHAYPHAQRAQGARQINKASFIFDAAMTAGGIAQVDAIGAGVLRDDQQLTYTTGHEALGLGHHFAYGSRHQITAQLRDDAEAAAVVAALGNFQIGIVPGR